MINLKLTVEPIPEKTYGKSLARLLPRQDWDKIRRLIYKRDLYTCRICSAVNCTIHCHEVWAYDDRKRRQILTDLLSLCEDCHNIKHWGFIIHQVNEGKLPVERRDDLRRHFCEVNGCTVEDMTRHIVEVGDIRWRRSRYQYKIDLSNLPTILREAERLRKVREK